MIQKIRPFKHLCMTIGGLPTSYLESMSYYETLCWLCKFLQDQVIPVVNNNSEVVEELQEFIKNYFDNLDVQEEINKKLDEMSEDGTLAEIIAQYIQLQGILAYNTVADMKIAENLVNGSFAETYGFYSYGDGGRAKYKIREVINTDIVDEMTLFALNNPELVGELIVENTINPLQLGAKFNGVDDDSTYIQKAIDLGNVIFPNKEGIINTTLNITSSEKIIDLNRAIMYCNANPVFRINEQNGENPLKWITIKNGSIKCNYNGIEIYDSYFIKLDDLSIKLLNSNLKGVLVENGFNNHFKALQIYGDENKTGNIGINYKINNSSTISGITNITNVNFEDCLIQRLATGLKIEGGVGGSYETNYITNCGFSYCSDYGIDMNSANLGNWNIQTVRCESSNKFLTTSNTVYPNLRDIVLFNTNGIENTTYLTIDGSFLHVATDGVTRYTIISNTGTVKFGNITKWQNNNTSICDNTVKLTKMYATSKEIWTSYNNLFYPQFINMKYTGNNVATVADIVAPEGGEMYILRRDGDAGWLLPNGTYTTAGTLYHLMKFNNVWNII